jgi:spermidine synthase
LLLMTASGFAGLGYQIVWTQQCALWLGHEAAAVLAVVGAFFGGLAVGALCLGRAIERSRHALRWYAGCEMLIAAWSLGLALGMAPVSEALLRLTGADAGPAWQWTVAFCGTFLLLLPATAAMGATLPSMERLTAQLRGAGRSLAPLYAANTFGAVLGVLCMAFWLVPGFGLVRTALFCVALNLACGLGAFALLPARVEPAAVSPARTASAATGALLRLGVTGFLGIGYEVLVVRVLSQVAEDTVYTFALLLAVYLVGSAAGAAAYPAWRARSRDAARLGDRLLCTLAAVIVAGTVSLWWVERVREFALHALGGGMGAALSAEAALALLAFGAPTFVMGALFCHLAAEARAAGASLGRALGVNTLGAAAAPALFGVVALPLLGPKVALLVIAAGYLLLAAASVRRLPVAWLASVGVLALALWAPPLAFVDVPAGGRVVSYEDGVMAAVSVVEDADGVARLRINNRQQEGSSASLRVDGRQAWLPLLLHPGPRRALFLGLGTGVTASAAAADPALQVEAVELLPEVIAASHFFTPLRVQARASDARRFVRASSARYDVIVADNYHPARSGSGSLYTVEHFRAVRARLADSGLFCQWLPLHQLDLDTLRSIVRSFLAVYPRGAALLASNSLDTPVVGLVGRGDDGRFDVDALRTRVAGVALERGPADFGIEDEFALLGSFVAGADALTRFAAEAPLNTDDHPVVAYRAPRITYAPDSQPRERLGALLRQLTLDPDEVVAPGTEAGWSRRLAAYALARNRFIETGRDVRPVADVRAMLAQVRGPLLAVLRESPDFRPAYDPLLRMAVALARVDADGARALLTELVELQPRRSEALRALDSLGDIAAR